MVHYVTGNIISDDYKIICHQVNCQKIEENEQIKSNYPEAYEAYEEREYPILGVIDWVRTHDGKVCVNMYSADDCGYPRQTDYIAFAACLSEMIEYLRTEPWSHTVAFPYGIGCSDGGDWSIISALIEDFDKRIEQEVYVVLEIE